MSEQATLRPLFTQWGEQLDKSCPLHEYPRPQLRRAGWMCLNGTWQYAIVKNAAALDGVPPDAWEGDITVPFSPESVLSGVQRQLLPGQTLWYRRMLELAPPVAGDRLLLHFGAVDQRCRVLCNGVEAGWHTGGYWPFSFDVTGLVHIGENEICVSVTDDANTGNEAYGKQTLRRGGIWYTAQSGIWQTVWCEHVPAQYIESVRITPLWRTGAVRLAVKLAGGVDVASGAAPEDVSASAPNNAAQSTPDRASNCIEHSAVPPRDFATELRAADAASFEYAKNTLGGSAAHAAQERFATATPPTYPAAPRVSAVILDAHGKAVAHADFPADQIAELPVPGARSWTPDDPYLYTLALTVGSDEVESYFGMREFGTGQDARGNPCLTLNGAPLFHSGLLDQGYWSDGLYTPPADAAMVWEIQQMKALGFNMLRKHIKIEPLRWYYHCDRLGMLVWQDFVSGGGPYHPLVTQVLPFVGVRLKDDRYQWFGRANAAGRAAAARDARRTVSLLCNCTSLAVWVPFNEGWGQFDAAQMCGVVRTLDGTRPIDHASGWHDQAAGDFQSYHIYYKEFRPRLDGSERVLALTEFGGYSAPVQEHMASDRRFGYKIYETTTALNDAVEMLYYREVLPAIAQGLAAAVYTQVSDVEDEINGVVTYDRRVVKLNPETFCALHKELYAAFYGKIEK